MPVQISIPGCPESLKEILQADAEANGRKLAEHIRFILKKYVEGLPATPAPSAAPRRKRTLPQ